MRVTVRIDVFHDECDTAALDALLHAAISRRHHLLIEDDRNEKFLGWLEGLQPRHRQKWKETIESGYRREALEPAERAIHVSAYEENWNAPIPIVSVNEAIDCLQKPFRILLEDQVSDRDFLFCMATRNQREFLSARIREGSIVVDNGGGITSMPRRVSEIANEGRRGVLHNWIMFDSDALQPGNPSAQSALLEEKCKNASVPYYRLQRRNIENYLTKNALRIWAYEDRRAREKGYLALLSLSDVQRSHYNFKEGFKGDEKRPPPGAGALFNGLPQGVVQLLHVGFGKKIGALFATEAVTEADLKRDGGWQEVNPVVTGLDRID
ncbi:MAG: hypothetical protein KIT48_02135 [Pseudolabrys sp.]|nr:hypothetical protein [Pseudolabrys sp.]